MADTAEPTSPCAGDGTWDRVQVQLLTMAVGACPRSSAPSPDSAISRSGPEPGTGTSFRPGAHMSGLDRVSQRVECTLVLFKYPRPWVQRDVLCGKASDPSVAPVPAGSASSPKSGGRVRHGSGMG